MIIIEIESPAYTTREGVSAKNGKPWKLCQQQILIHGFYSGGFPSRYPRTSTIQLDADKPQPFANGKYVISAEAFFFGDFDELILGRKKIQPLEEFLTEISAQFGLSMTKTPLKAAA